MCLVVGNSGGQFSIDLMSGLIARGQRALDRETSSSHLLEVEAYNSDQGSMRSFVRVCVCVCTCILELYAYLCTLLSMPVFHSSTL